MKKENQKNTTMRIALLVLMFVMITSSLVGGTFAKYVSSTSANDSARVAKWGVGPSTSIDLFAESYTNTAGKVVIKSANPGTRVVAPGASGSYEFKFVTPSGNPEVAYKLKATFAGEYEGDWDGEYPLIFQLDNNGEDLTLPELLTRLGSLETPTIFPGETPDENTGKHTISWRWPFERTTEDGTETKDTADTILGNKAITNDLKVKIDVKIIAEQVQ